jgi:hypothetical protein
LEPPTRNPPPVLQSIHRKVAARRGYSRRLVVAGPRGIPQRMTFAREVVDWTDWDCASDVGRVDGDWRGNDTASATGTFEG